jgi:ATP:ADP antiporter, AAA family
MQRGIEAVRWLFIGTAVVTLLVNPVFGLLVSRFRRLQFITATYALLRRQPAGLLPAAGLAPEAVGET